MAQGADGEEGLKYKSNWLPWAAEQWCQTQILERGWLFAWGSSVHKYMDMTHVWKAVGWGAINDGFGLRHVKCQEMTAQSRDRCAGKGRPCRQALKARTP